jgi:hypothetical protein
MGSFSVWHWLILLLVLLPGVLYLLNLQWAMEAVDAELRPMAPGLVWLLPIPLVNIVWMFFVVTHLKTGYAKVGAAGRPTAASGGGYGLGLALAICPALSIVRIMRAGFAGRAGALDHPLGDGEQGAWAGEAGRRGRAHKHHLRCNEQ